MRETLFYVPHVLFEGWLFWGWVVVGAAIILWQGVVRRRADEAIGFLPIYVVVGALLWWLFPRLETMGVNPVDPQGPPEPRGLAVRGYGAFMLTAILTGLGVAWIRCRQIRFDFERILTLSFWMVIAGIVGARAFYVIQKWPEFHQPGQPLDWWRIVDMTRGGLVVYGSLIGGIVAAVVYIRMHRLPWGDVADILAPSLALGLAIGRLGCLMNGCCYGGLCAADVPGIAFPPGSPPYMDQLAKGELLGLRGEWSDGVFEVREVVAGSVAERRGVKPGDQLIIRIPPSELLRDAHRGRLKYTPEVWIESPRLGVIEIPITELPQVSMRVHPTQIYSSINALLLFLITWFYFPYRRHRGEVFAWLLVLYAFGRFLLEIIRDDEAGMWNTPFTISQWVSFVMAAFGFGLLFYLYARTPRISRTGQTGTADGGASSPVGAA